MLGGGDENLQLQCPAVAAWLINGASWLSGVAIMNDYAEYILSVGCYQPITEYVAGLFL